MLRDYWMEFLIVAYIFTSIDLILTAKGILHYGMYEGNRLVTMFVPNGSPYLIPFMVISTIAIYWTIFYACTRPTFSANILGVISFLSLCAVGTHTFGISTWTWMFV